MTPSTIYWITRLNYIRSLCDDISLTGLILLVVSLSLLIITVVMASRTPDDIPEAAADIIGPRKGKFTCLVALILGLIFIPGLAKPFIPTTKEMCAIQIIPAVANSEEVGKLRDMGSDVLSLASDWLKEQVAQRKAK